MFEVKKFILDLVFPVECLACKREGDWLCSDCQIKLPSKSLEPVKKFDFMDGVWVVADYDNQVLSRLLHLFKYNFVLDLSQYLADLLVNFLRQKIDNQEISNFDLIIAVPLSRRRKLWRGFNQAEILAQHLSLNFGWPTSVNILYRRYNTRPQVGLKAKARLRNVQGVFGVKNLSSLKNTKVLLIDDVITTGATISECAKVLKHAGASEVWGLVLAEG